MKRPAFQFYPDDWIGNQKLGRCSKAARGAWIDTLCALHDSDEYGLVRYPLRELADVAHVPVKLMRELVDKGVLKGSDNACAAFVFVPRHAGRDGEPVTLIAANDGPCWYSSRMVRDEYVRAHAGASTRFKASGSPPAIPSRRDGEPPSRVPSQRQGDGASSPSPTPLKATSKTKAARKRAIPPDFAISDSVRTWAEDKGYGDLTVYLEHFVGRNAASGKEYLDWDQTFMNAIREDWYGVRKGGNGHQASGRESRIAEQERVAEALTGYNPRRTIDRGR